MNRRVLRKNHVHRDDIKAVVGNRYWSFSVEEPIVEVFIENYLERILKNRT